ncbi:GNAT family N-acetyltransferase [Endozoicomonas arenosclerae]|uniref:GNAT family N-acetyltransferase n=1 Tax=Endozoicomonas arenosclerae TaxID=1633495 RepID=UPI000781FBE3|nr:GNAT family N-acetyltransferase [Endozoicomonas arenosclerae]
MSTGIRKARRSEWDEIFLMGYEAWGDGDTKELYLKECHESEKYQQGVWYVYESEGIAVSSLIVYQNLFNLPEGCFGVGSVATRDDQLRKGYASRLVKEISDNLGKSGAKGIYLFSDIDPEFYRRQGFESVSANQPYKDTTCMVLSFNNKSPLPLQIPQYF